MTRHFASLALSLAALALTRRRSPRCGGGSDEVPARRHRRRRRTRRSRSAEYDAAHRPARRRPTRTPAAQFPKAGTPEYNALKSQAVTLPRAEGRSTRRRPTTSTSRSARRTSTRSCARSRSSSSAATTSEVRAGAQAAGLPEEELRDTAARPAHPGRALQEGHRRRRGGGRRHRRSTTTRTRRSGTPRRASPRRPPHPRRRLRERPGEDRRMPVERRGPREGRPALRPAQGRRELRGAREEVLGDPASKDNGGKLTVVEGQTVAPFNQTAFTSARHVLSRPVKTQYGYHIIEPLSKIKPKTVQPLAKVKEQIRQELLQTEKNEAMTEWVKDTREGLLRRRHVLPGRLHAATRIPASRRATTPPGHRASWRTRA